MCVCVCVCVCVFYPHCYSTDEDTCFPSCENGGTCVLGECLCPLNYSSGSFCECKCSVCVCVCACVRACVRVCVVYTNDCYIAND